MAGIHKFGGCFLKQISFVLMLIVAKAGAAAPFGVGQKDYVFEDRVRNRKIATHVWYPIDPKLKALALSDGSPFLPVVAAMDAPFAKTTSSLPVILLSHGSGGRADKLFWLTQYLVQSGNIVLGVDHPGNMTGDNSADGLMRIWERPRDLSFALDRLLENPDFTSRIDPTRVAAAGHSAGGTTTLLLAGARLSSAKFTSPIPECAGTKDPYYAAICKQMKSLDLKSFPKRIVEGEYADTRVKAIVALDPGMSRSFEDSSFKKLTGKPYLLLAEKNHAPQDEIYSKEFLNKLPAGEVEVVPNSFHMTFLQACRPDYPKDDPELKELCIDNDAKLRIQNTVAQKSLAFFQRIWGKRLSAKGRTTGSGT